MRWRNWIDQHCNLIAMLASKNQEISMITMMESQNGWLAYKTGHTMVRYIKYLFATYYVLFTDTSVSDQLFQDVRVLCWVMTHESNLKSKATAVRKTWGKRCNKLLFSADHENPDFPTIKIDVKNGRDYLSHKTFATFQYVYDNHMDDADWFMKADDDTYVVMENLRHLLSSHSPDEPIYFGHLFKAIVKKGYPSGGAGYIVSKEAMRRFGKRKRSSPECKPRRRAAEDVEMGKCLQHLNVTAADGRDKFNRTRFHCLAPLDFIQGKYPDWLNTYSKWRPEKV